MTAAPSRRSAMFALAGAVAVATLAPTGVSTPSDDHLRFDPTRPAYVLRGQLVVPFVVQGMHYDRMMISSKDTLWCDNQMRADWGDQRHDLYVAQLAEHDAPVLRWRRDAGTPFDFTEAEMRRAIMVTPVRCIEFWRGSRADDGCGRRRA